MTSVPDRLRAPLRCPQCGGDMHLRDGPHGWFRACVTRGCDVAITLHAETGEPKGIPANRRTRVARQNLHAKFDSVYLALVLAAWSAGQTKTRHAARTQMYTWLAVRMNLTAEQAHIGMFNEAQCASAQALLDAITDDDLRHLARPYNYDVAM